MTTQDETKSTMPGATRAAARFAGAAASACAEAASAYAASSLDLARAGSERTIAPIAGLLRKPAC